VKSLRVFEVSNRHITFVIGVEFQL
jgi:hypothetical protein